MRFVVSSLLALSLMGTAQAATIENVKVEITYNVADLETPEGAKNVLETIEGEARKDCRIGGAYKRIVHGMIDNACYQDIVAKAVAQIDAPNLNRVYQAKLRK